MFCCVQLQHTEKRCERIRNPDNGSTSITTYCKYLLCWGHANKFRLYVLLLIYILYPNFMLSTRNPKLFGFGITRLMSKINGGNMKILGILKHQTFNLPPRLFIVKMFMFSTICPIFLLCVH